MTPLEKKSDRPDPDAVSPGLYVVATPIGRLSDLGMRAARVLREVDVVAAEDTRVSRLLLDHLGARPTLIACHAHNEAGIAVSIVQRIRDGRAVALVSDAGTPGISDPGARLVAAVHEAGLPVIPIPGPSAVAALLSVSGLSAARFHFDGFLPTRAAARQERLAKLADSEVVVVCYESPHRIVETAQDLVAALPPDRIVVVGRELTKRFEQVHRTPAGGLMAWLQADDDHRRGEFVLAFDAAAPRQADANEDPRISTDQLLAALCAELPPRQAARIAARLSPMRANALYQRALALKRAGVDERAGDREDDPPSSDDEAGNTPGTD